MERVLDAGITAYTLVVIGIALAYRNVPAYRWGVVVSLLTIVASLILCAGPYVQVSYWRIPVPFGFLRIIPGFGSLRAPGRLWQIGLFAISIMSGVTIWRLLEQFNSKIAALLCMVVGVAIVSCLRSSPSQSAAIVLVPPVCPWMNEVLPDEAVLLHAPWVLEGKVENGIFVWPDAEKMFCAIYHRRKISNGSLAYMPPEQQILQQCLVHFPSDQAMDCVHRVGITHILMDRKDISVDLNRQLDDPGELFRFGLVELYHDGTHTLYSVSKEMR